MIIKFTTELGYFLADACYRDEIIDSTITYHRYTFSTNEHTFVYDANEDKFKTDGYDVVEVDFADALHYESTNDDVIRLWNKLDHSKKYFMLWH